MSPRNIKAIHKKSIDEPNQFWLKAAEGVHWEQFPLAAICDDSTNKNSVEWFAGGKINSCYNAVDIHVKTGHGEQIAIAYESPVTNRSDSITYNQLLEQVSRFAGALSARGLEKGDRVVIYMPMIPQAIIAMLACARIGVIHSVVFGGFAAKELAVRIDDATPKAIISASCGVEINRIIDYKLLLNKALKQATHQPDVQIIYQRPEHLAALNLSTDIDWLKFVTNAPMSNCVSLDATDPLYILYTSGTTGKPKGVIRDNGGHCVALKWSMSNIYNVKPGDVYWAASDIGWVVGHSYIVYGPLFNRNTTVLYEGKPIGTPDASAFWRIIEKYKVKVLFTAPTAIRAIKKEDPKGELVVNGGFNLESLSALFLAGERSDPDTIHWAKQQLNVPVIDHWWQTETGWSICANCLGIEALPVIEGSPTMPVPGYNLKVLGIHGEQLKPGEVGALAIKTPLPPGNFTGLWQDKNRFQTSYFSSFPGYYETGDAGYIDEQGYVYVMARTDDIINVAGHRLSTGAIEEVISSHKDIAECAVIGIPCSLKGEVPISLLVLNNQTSGSLSEIQDSSIKMVREQLGAVYSYKNALVVKALPKTRSGKVLRGTMKKIAQGKTYTIPATIDDPKILGQIEKALATL